MTFTLTDSPKQISVLSILKLGKGLAIIVASMEELLLHPLKVSVTTTAFEIVLTGVSDQSTCMELVVGDPTILPPSTNHK